MGDVMVLGLSGDPFHTGHSELVRSAVIQLSCRGYSVSDVILVPTGYPHPQKMGMSTPFVHRMAMCRLGARYVADELEDAAISVRCTSLEHLMQCSHAFPEPSYTIETLLVMLESLSLWGGRERIYDNRFILLMGSDNLEGECPQFKSWVGHEGILVRAVLAVCPRSSHPPNLSFVRSLRDTGIVELLDAAVSSASSNDIRELIWAGEDSTAPALSGLLPPAVAEYIHTHRLYRRGGEGWPVWRDAPQCIGSTDGEREVRSSCLCMGNMAVEDTHVPYSGGSPV